MLFWTTCSTDPQPHVCMLTFLCCLGRYERRLALCRDFQYTTTDSIVNNLPITDGGDGLSSDRNLRFLVFASIAMRTEIEYRARRTSAGMNEKGDLETGDSFDFDNKVAAAFCTLVLAQKSV